VVTVGLPGQLYELAGIKQKFDRYNINFRVQYLKNKDWTGHEYTAKEMERLKSLNSGFYADEADQRQSLVQTEDQSCFCGANSIVMNCHGDVIRCHPVMGKKRFMGNILNNNFGLYGQAEYCEEKECYCLERYSAWRMAQTGK